MWKVFEKFKKAILQFLDFVGRFVANHDDL
jgi:hypothetical protein